VGGIFLEKGGDLIFFMGQNFLTAARNGGKIDMSLPEPQIRRQDMALMTGSSVEELAARDAAQSKITFAATENDRYLDVMRRVEFEAAGKILDDHSDRSAIASIVKAKSSDKEMKRVKAQVRQCLKEVIDDLGYQPTPGEQMHWRTHNPGAFSHLKSRYIATAVRQCLLVMHAHTQKLTIISGLSIQDAHALRCNMQAAEAD